MGYSQPVQDRRGGWVVAVVAMAFALVMLFALTQCNSEAANLDEDAQAVTATETTSDESNGGDTAEEESATVAQPCTIAVDDMSSLPTGDSISTFSLNDTIEAPSLSSTDLLAIQQAVDTIEGTPETYSDDGNDATFFVGGSIARRTTDMSGVGFVLLDVDSGLGISYNVDQDVYTASAIKAPYVDYVLQTAGDDGFSSYIATCIENALTWSDNDSYYTLREAYDDGDGFNQWMKGLGVDIAQDDYLDTDPYYPRISTRELARLWADIYQYTSAGGENATWFYNLLTETETSFIRDGINARGVEVADKAGWIGMVGYNAVNDAAIITEGGNTYLMVIMTSQTDGNDTEENESALASALFNARSTLDYDFSA